MSTNLLGRIGTRSVSRGLTVGVCIAIGVIVAAPARAATFVGTTSDATGIDGLVVDEETYNVTFVNDSYNDVYASTPPTFLGNETGADDAATSLASALNSLDISQIAGLPGVSELYLYVPFVLESLNEGRSALVRCIYCSPPPVVWYGEPGPLLFGRDVVNSDIDYTIFSVVTTPLPAALPLFATVLGVGGLLGWRRKRKSVAGAIPAA